MNGMHYLYAAYIAAGVIHLAYIFSLARRYQRVRRKFRELDLQDS